MTDHPLTEEAVAERLDADARLSRWKNWTASGRAAIVSAFRAAFDAGREHERANPVDDRPWEPLNGPVRVGDEVRQERAGITITAVVGRVDKYGDPWTAGEGCIGVLSVGTWYVRRAVQELPTEDGAVIVPAEGREFIETRTGKKSRRLTWDAESYVWYDAHGTHLDADIITGTWKLADQ